MNELIPDKTAISVIERAEWNYLAMAMMAVVDMID